MSNTSMSETKLMALREAVNLAMSEEMRKDPDIFLMGEDVGIYGGDFGTSVGMLAEFGENVLKIHQFQKQQLLVQRGCCYYRSSSNR